MAYLDQPQMSGRKLQGLIFAGVLTIAPLAAVILFGAETIKKAIFKPIETVQIEEPPPEEPPPPPEKQQEIPVVAPPPDVVVDIPPPPQAPTVQTNIVAPPAPSPPVVAPPAPAPPPPAPPPAPPAPSQASAAKLRGSLQSVISQDDYPPASLRAEEEGTTSVAIEVNAQGRVSSCTVTQSSGHPRLDEQTCTLVTRRARYDPAKDTTGASIASKASFRFKWVIPKG